MNSFPDIDAYRVLGLPFDATEEEIRKTYHMKLKTEEDTKEDTKKGSETLRQAYNLIRNEKARKQYAWNSLHSYILQPPFYKEEAADLEGAAAEILFLSEWELGEIDAPRSL